MLLARLIPSAVRRPSVSDVAANCATARAPDAVTATATAMAVVLASALLIFFSLDNRVLWMDEAETALLGRSILDHGVPTAFDGRNIISQEVGREYGPDYVWWWTPWLDKYLAAASFAVLGASTFSARFPFALLGLLCVISMYPLALAFFRDRWIGVLAMAFLALSVPFILHVRQCRYYSPAILCTIWVFYFFAGMVRGRRFAVAGFVAATTLLFQSSILNAATTVVALVPCALVSRFDAPALRRVALAAAFVLLLNAPSVYLFSPATSEPRLYRVWDTFRVELALTNRYTFPFVTLPLFLALAWWARRRPFVESSAWRPFLVLTVFLGAYLATVTAAPWFFYRYTVGLLPVASVLLAFMCASLLRWSRLVGAPITACLLLTAMFHVASPLPQPFFNMRDAKRQAFQVYDVFFPLGNVLHELTRPYPGPMELLLNVLAQSAAPTDRVFISYGDLVVAFYTGLEVRGGQSGRPLDGWPEPEWIVVRNPFSFVDRPVHRVDADRKRTWVRSILDRNHYVGVLSPATDTPWDNIPEPHLHWYRVPEGGPPMRIARRQTP
jgi:Dolichyl-phosphate-mannose-protein mannosyltransferase